MPKLLKNKLIVDDSWQILPKDYDGAIPSEFCFVPLNYWQENKSALSEIENIGVWLDSDDEPDQLAGDYQTLHHLALNFPTFMDGRGFSTARLIRERYHFSGELRAIGHFIPDQLFYLSRCGFDAFRLAGEQFTPNPVLENQSYEDFLNAFSVSYQACANDEQPLFRRRQR